MRLNVEPITEQSQFWNNVNALAEENLPPEEYPAPSQLVSMSHSGSFEVLALLDGDTFVGFVAVLIYEDLAYLFFLAIDAACRDRGYGSRTIETLQAEYPGKTHTVDFEMPNDAAPKREQRQKNDAAFI